jgi:uncharacterized protein YcfL
MKKTIFLSAVAVVMLTGAGCQNTVNTLENANKSMHPDYVLDKRVVTDGYLRDRLALTNVVMVETADGLMQAQVDATNLRTGAADQFWSSITSENPYRIRYKFTWFTQDGLAVESIVSDWQDASIIPGETCYLRSVAPRKDCKDFRLSIKEANN